MKYKLPEPSEPEIYKTCPECNGKGVFDFSSCCGAYILPDGTCYECRENAFPETCWECGGSGEVPFTEDDYQNLWEREEEMRQDEKKFKEHFED